MILLYKLNDCCAKIEKVFLTCSLLFMLVLGMLQVIARFIIKSPIPWSEGLLTYLFIWTSYMGAALGMYNLEHFSVDIITTLMPKTVQKILSGFVYFAIFVFAIFVMYRGVFLALNNKNQMIPLLPFTMVIPYFALPVSHVFIAVHVITHFSNLFKKEEAK